jgi:hypothetical protein
MKTPKYCNFAFISLKKNLLESVAWYSLTLKQQWVFFYISSCLQWHKEKRKKAYPTNNGKIEISTIKMGKNLGISKQTCSSAVHKLIEVGLIKLTRVGENRVCHMYKILYEVVPQNEERWKKYPQQNWKDKCPKAPNTLVGLKTRFKSHPNKVDLNSKKQSSRVDLNKGNSQVELTQNDINEGNKQSTSLGSII